MERTFAMIKPDGVKRGLTAEVLARIIKKGYRIVGLKQMVIPREVAEKHYGEQRADDGEQCAVVGQETGHEDLSGL